MIEMTLQERVAAEQATGHDSAIEPPQECRMLWQRARAAGIPLGRLAILRRPLTAARIGGAWNRSTGDIWVLQSDDPAETLRRLLHELAHAERQSPRPATIDEDWNEEAVTEHRARELAQRWDVGASFDGLPLSRSLAQIETLRERHHLAADLAATRDPFQARAAYDAICNLAHSRRWGEATLEAALYDADEDDAVNAAIVDFSRAGLRASWRVGHGIGGSFGPLACQQDTRSGTTLRAALHQAGALNVDWLSRRLVISTDAPRRLSLLLTLSEAAALPAVLSAAQALLLAHPDQSLLATWRCYGEPTEAVRTYQLSVSVDQETTNLWVLLRPRRPRDRIVEAALQRFILTWAEVTAIRSESFAEGLLALWAQHG
jgi:hypothetical protein